MPELSPLYVENASPDSIRHQIKLARDNRDRWQRRVDDLARLLDQRLGQIDAGTWPPGTSTSPEAAPDAT